jgi:hypothetical protein
MNEELQVYQDQVDAAFAAMNTAKQYMKTASTLRFTFPFGSEERATAEGDYEQALSDYHAKADAFAAARKLYDDSRMHLLARKGR